jgi:hypothetical protein
MFQHHYDEDDDDDNDDGDDDDDDYHYQQMAVLSVLHSQAESHRALFTEIITVTIP